ncbi:hypothetical protein OH807_02795 [Kitasatospora sp. NBC_01560]|uniref:hypothetical protein n=1 Tax=Kitasatospora sp. NBC_01560 TaxID=2975965 RepID=UPI00386AA7B1
MPTPRRPLACATLLLACALTACSSTPPGPGHAAASSSRSDVNASSALTIRNFAFEPAAVSRRPGDTVTATNQDTTAHTLTVT